MEMSLLGIESGCKVGWEIYDNEEEARSRVPAVVAEAERRAEQGYDFGYSCPGDVRYTDFYYRHGDKKDQPSYEDCWILTTS